MIITRKIEVRFKDEEKEANFKKWINLMPLLHNTIVTNIFLNELISDRIVQQDEYFNKPIIEIDEKVTEKYESLKGCKDEKKRVKVMKEIETLQKRKKFYKS